MPTRIIWNTSTAKEKLSREEYQSQDQALEELEDKLDAAEDQLEWTFGIDD